MRPPPDDCHIDVRADGAGRFFQVADSEGHVPPSEALTPCPACSVVLVPASERRSVARADHACGSAMRLR